MFNLKEGKIGIECQKEQWEENNILYIFPAFLHSSEKELRQE